MELLIKALPAIISAVCLGLMSWTAVKLKKMLNEFNVLKTSQRNQLKMAIVEKYEKANERGYITPMSLDIVNNSSVSYFELGGNSYVSALLKRMNEDMDVHGIPIPEE